MSRTRLATLTAAAAAAAVTAATVTALAVPGAATASGSGYGPPLLRSGLVGSTPAPAGPTLFGITPGTAPWVVRDATVRVGRSGRIEARIRGLVIPTAPANGTNPVPQLTLSLVCNGAVADTTAPVPFDTRGNARVHEVLTVPSPCLAPAVLVNPNGNTAVYIAATG